MVNIDVHKCMSCHLDIVFADSMSLHNIVCVYSMSLSCRYKLHFPVINAFIGIGPAEWDAY